MRVTDNAGERTVEALVNVDDGVGRFKVPGRAKDVSVAADPDGQLLLYERKVDMVKTLPEGCEAPPKKAEAPEKK